jgi:hypothetical protein
MLVVEPHNPPLWDPEVRSRGGVGGYGPTDVEADVGALAEVEVARRADHAKHQ